VIIRVGLPKGLDVLRGGIGQPFCFLQNHRIRGLDGYTGEAVLRVLNDGRCHLFSEVPPYATNAFHVPIRNKEASNASSLVYPGFYTE